VEKGWKQSIATEVDAAVDGSCWHPTQSRKTS